MRAGCSVPDEVTRWSIEVKLKSRRPSLARPCTKTIPRNLGAQLGFLLVLMGLCPDASPAFDCSFTDFKSPSRTRW